MESLSIIIPCYNSGNKINILIPEILKTLSGLNFEIILVNDGSTDNTWEEIKKSSDLFTEVKGISLRQNSGQQNAVFAGIYFSSGSYIITMDDDLEHNPEVIPDLIKKADEGFDLVYAVSRKKYSFFRRAGSFAHDIFFYTVFRKPLKLKITSFRIMKRKLAEKIKAADKHFIYISAIALRFKPHVTYIETAPVSVSESRYRIKTLIILFTRLALNYCFPDFFYSFIHKHLFSGRNNAKEKILDSAVEFCGDFNK